MKKLVFLIAAAYCFYFSTNAQEVSPHETGLSYMKEGDFDNAIIVFNRALQQNPKNLELKKDLVLAYYYKRDYSKALEHLQPLLEHDEADIIVYQIAGNVYKALEDVKEADKMYKKALKKFSNSGALYSEYGELLLARKDPAAIEQWEKGIEADPSYSGNYYNAALYYATYTGNVVWPILYGEIFVNMESLSERGSAMRKLLLSLYKEKLFADPDVMKSAEKNKNDFAQSFLSTLNKQSELANRGITTQTLTMIRTRFILDWYNTYASQYPFRLFDYQQQLLQEGMFEAYNQWLFGTIENLAAYDNWTKTHPDQYNTFTEFQKGRIFKIPAGQHYQNK